MTISSIFIILFSITTIKADTGGPYQFVPDLSATEVSPILAIPKVSHPLTYFVTHLPTPKWENNKPEPSSLAWLPLKDYNASIKEVGYVGGHQIFSIRYISKERLNLGTTQADRILIVARQGGNSKFSPVYFTTGGAAILDHNAKLGTTGQSILLEVSRHHSGTGGHVDKIYFDKSELGLVRFTAKSNKTKKANKSQ